MSPVLTLKESKMSFKGFSTNSSLLKNSINSKKLLQDQTNLIRYLSEKSAILTALKHRLVSEYRCSIITVPRNVHDMDCLMIFGLLSGYNVNHCRLGTVALQLQG